MFQKGIVFWNDSTNNMAKLSVLCTHYWRHMVQLAERMLREADGAVLHKLHTLHKHLLGQLTKVISNPQASSREVAVAVAGIGHLAAPTHRFFGQQVGAYLDVQTTGGSFRVAFGLVWHCCK